MTKISPMLVVSDADVLIHLSKLEKLSILKALYKEVAIPKRLRISEFTTEANFQLAPIHFALPVIKNKGSGHRH